VTAKRAEDAEDQSENLGDRRGLGGRVD